MIGRDDILVIEFTEEQIQKCKARAENACIGGRSNVHSNREDRNSNLNENQLCGQLGEMALSIFLTGSTDAYEEARDKADANPTEGDDGYDLLEFRVNAKASFMRSKSRRMSEYHLIIPEDEASSDFCYIMMLIECPPYQSETRVHLMGCSTIQNMVKRNKPNWNRPKYLKMAKDLDPISSIRIDDWRDLGVEVKEEEKREPKQLLLFDAPDEAPSRPARW